MAFQFPKLGIYRNLLLCIVKYSPPFYFHDFYFLLCFKVTQLYIDKA